MGTRSRIGVMHGDVCKSVYCHWDGYLDNNGRILQEYYQDSAKVNNLISHGDISSLGERVVPEGAHNFENPEKGTTVFYGRDRGETNIDWQQAHTFDDFLKQVDDSMAEYYYIFKDGTWYCGTAYSSGALAGKLVPLAEALANQKEFV